MRRRSDILMLLGIIGLFLLALLTIYPLNSTRFGRQGLRLGLDLKGGTYLVYQADLTKRATGQSENEAMEAVKLKIERRVNAYGVAEPIIQRQGGDRITVQLPGVRNIEEAIRLIGQTAQLEFGEFLTGDEGNLVVDELGNILTVRDELGNSFNRWVVAEVAGKELNGSYFKRASVGFDQFGKPKIDFELNEEGGVIFKQVTTRNINEPLGIFLDKRLISSPTIRAVIESIGEITGNFTPAEAKNLVNQLNSGALDVPLSIVQQQDIDPTLGADSLRKSLVAGVIGVALLFIFMIAYYRLLGAVACLALLIYGAVVLAIFKMVPVTLTLAGMAGFILSLGMAVDANVLIFERMKEELHGGRTLGAAVEAGFIRAWSAIRDSNLTTIIACVVLYWFGSKFGAPQVMGFAATLFFGIIVSMFTAMLVTRTFLRTLLYTPIAKRLGLFKLGQ